MASAEPASVTVLRIAEPDALVSIDSPLARALLRARIGEHVEVELPNGRARFRVLAINYR